MKNQESWFKWVSEGITTKQEARECINHIQENYSNVDGDVKLKFDRDLGVLNQFLRSN